VAVVDNKGKLMGSLSASDVKGSLDGNIFTDFYLPITMYLDKCHPQFQRENAEHPVTCMWDDTIEDVLAKLIKRKVHRLFIVDEEGRPVDTISLCDVITVLQKTDVRK
jgi:CBS domain-containing protein